MPSISLGSGRGGGKNSDALLGFWVLVGIGTLIAWVVQHTVALVLTIVFVVVGLALWAVVSTRRTRAVLDTLQIVGPEWATTGHYARVAQMAAGGALEERVRLVRLTYPNMPAPVGTTALRAVGQDEAGEEYAVRIYVTDGKPARWSWHPNSVLQAGKGGNYYG